MSSLKVLVIAMMPDEYYEVLAIAMNMNCYHYERNERGFKEVAGQLANHMRNRGYEDDAKAIEAKAGINV